jgi:hypothetical protein
VTEAHSLLIFLNNCRTSMVLAETKRLAVYSEHHNVSLETFDSSIEV